MAWYYIVALVLALWWLCGTINVGVVQAVFGNQEFGYSRNSTLCMCYIPAPFIFVGFFVVLVAYFPVKLGTRWGRIIGRKVEHLFN